MNEIKMRMSGTEITSFSTAAGGGFLMWLLSANPVIAGFTLFAGLAAAWGRARR